jgi:hypothetical protein
MCMCVYMYNWMSSLSELCLHCISIGTDVPAFPDRTPNMKCNVCRLYFVFGAWSGWTDTYIRVCVCMYVHICVYGVFFICYSNMVICVILYCPKNVLETLTAVSNTVVKGQWYTAALAPHLHCYFLYVLGLGWIRVSVTMIHVCICRLRYVGM